MKAHFLVLSLSLLAVSVSAADLPSIPDKSIAKKKDLLFSDDLNGTEHDKRWHRVVDTFTFENGALKGTQTREKDAPSKDGKSVIKAHAAVYGLEVPTRDSVVELRFKCAGATFVSVEFDDRKYTGAHYGHICYARVTPKSVILVDQKEGTMRNDIYAMTDPSQKAERTKLLEGRSATFPAQISSDEWHTLVVETVGDTMRASVDGRPAAFLKSPGIGHPTKSKLEFGCGGRDGWFEDIKVWNADPAKP
jgi:hypothetical protein